MKKIFVDTDIVIDFSKQKNEILKSLLTSQIDRKVELYINPIIITEFFVGQNIHNKTQVEQAQKLFRKFNSIEIDIPTGYTAAKLIQDHQGLVLGDSLIAASCILHKLTLATRNLKHFQNITKLKLYTP